MRKDESFAEEKLQFLNVKIQGAGFALFILTLASAHKRTVVEIKAVMPSGVLAGIINTNTWRRNNVFIFYLESIIGNIKFIVR